MNSVISFPSRGHYGKPSYRGNCSGFVIKELINHFQPEMLVDVCEGSGTAREVCSEMKVDYVGLDLHRGFDFTKDSVLSRLPRPTDICFSHPPYHDMIDYVAEREKHGLSGKKNGQDLSQCSSVEEFLELSQLMLLNQREATRPGGVYTTLIGDMRSKGKFYSFQSDFIKMLPTSELMAVTIKMQHNVLSNQRQYNGSTIFIQHEYLILWKKGVVTLAQVAWDKAKELQAGMNTTWRNFVKMALMNLGGEATLDRIYREVENVAGEKIKANANYQAKIRQTLQKHFENVDRGRWAMS